MTFFRGGMDSEFGGRQGEDQPAVSGVDGWKLEDVTEQDTNGVSIFRVHESMDAIDHEPLLPRRMVEPVVIRHKGGELSFLLTA
jgi:hypothetical protein